MKAKGPVLLYCQEVLWSWPATPNPIWAVSRRTIRAKALFLSLARKTKQHECSSYRHLKNQTDDTLHITDRTSSVRFAGSWKTHFLFCAAGTQECFNGRISWMNQGEKKDFIPVASQGLPLICPSLLVCHLIQMGAHPRCWCPSRPPNRAFSNHSGKCK